jgi:hypothetical protein
MFLSFHAEIHLFKQEKGRQFHAYLEWGSNTPPTNWFWKQVPIDSANPAKDFWKEILSLLRYQVTITLKVFQNALIQIIKTIIVKFLHEYSPSW